MVFYIDGKISLQRHVCVISIDEGGTKMTRSLL